MYLNFLLIVCSFFSYLTETNTLSNTDLLTGGSSKNWNIVNSLPYDSIYSCGYPNPHSSDNTWTFSSNNTFSFDPGQVKKTVYPNRLCVDKSAFSGTWSFSENETILIMTINKIENVAVDPIVISATLQNVTASEMTMIINDEDGLITYIYTPK